MSPQTFSPNSFQTFGDLLKYLRRREHLTQLELSIVVGYSEAQIGRLEKNQRRPDLTALQAHFIPALHLDNDPDLAARFLELAESARQEDAPTPGVAPYKGLLFFDEADADLFFGREALTTHLAERVTALRMDASTRLLTVVGASGSGKSSLVRAGLAVALRHAGWDVRIFTPGANPLRALERQLDQDQARAESDRFLIVADQFEEVFTLCRDEAERVAFIQKLIALAQHASHKTTIVITLRADFYSHCAQYPALRKSVAAQQEYIGQMTTEELRRAIEEPARYGKWEFEPGLVDVLLQDIGADGTGQPEPGALPLLSHALLATWERRRGRMFTLDGYRASGGVRGAIAETAESVFSDQLDREGQALAQAVFLRLTELGEGTDDTRRRAALNELVNRPGQASQLRAVLNTLAEARLVTLNEDSAEVAHEALIREWQRLHEWLSQDREGLKLHRHLTDSAREWEILGHDAGALYRGARLAQVREWTVANQERLNETERAFLEASIEHEHHEALEREAQHQREVAAAKELAETQRQSASHLQIRNRVITTIGSIAVILALLAGTFGMQSNYNAGIAQDNAATAQIAKDNAVNAHSTAQAEAVARATQQSIAEANFTHSEAQRLAAEATNLINVGGSSETAALLTLRSLNLEYTPQGDAVLLNVVNLHYPLRVFTGNQHELDRVAFSPDDRFVLTGSKDGLLRLFDAKSVRQLQIFSGHTAEINDITFSSDGNLVLTASVDQTARLWDLATGREVQKFVGHTNMVITAAFYGDGTQILTGSEDKTLRLWDVETGSELNQWFLEEPVSAFSSDGSYAVGYSEADNANHLWDLKTLTKIHSFSYPGQPIRWSTHFSPEGRYLLAVYGNEIVVSDVASGQELQVFRGHTDTSWDLALSPDGTRVLSASYDGSARLWDIQTGQEIRQFRGHIGAVNSVAFSSDGQKVLTGGADGVVLLWDIEPHPELPVINGENGGMFGVAFSPDGTHLATNVVTNVLQMWDVATGQLLWSTKDSGLALWALAFSPDGEYLLSGNMDGVATLWDAESGQEVRQFSAQGLDEISAVAFSPDGKTIVAGGVSFEVHDKFVPMWEVETGKEILRFPVLDVLFGMSYSRDGKYVFTGGGGNGVSYLWDAQTGKEVRELVGNAVGSGTSFSPDGKYVVTVESSTGFVVDVQTGQEIHRFIGPAAGLANTIYSPDGKFIAAAAFDGNVYLWDAQTGQQLRRYQRSTVANNIAFSPDSQHLVSVGNDGIARFFDVDYRITMEYLCSILLRDFTEAERIQYNIADTTPTCPP